MIERQCTSCGLIFELHSIKYETMPVDEFVCNRCKRLMDKKNKPKQSKVLISNKGKHGEVDE